MTCKITLLRENLSIWMEGRKYHCLLSASWAHPIHLESSIVFKRRRDCAPPQLRSLRTGSSAISYCVVLQAWVQLVFLILFRCCDVEPQAFDSHHLSASNLCAPPLLFSDYTCLTACLIVLRITDMCFIFIIFLFLEDLVEVRWYPSFSNEKVVLKSDGFAKIKDSSFMYQSMSWIFLQYQIFWVSSLFLQIQGCSFSLHSYPSIP